MNKPQACYASPVFLLRKTEKNSFELLDHDIALQLPLSFVAIKPVIQQQRQAQLHAKVAETMKKKIEVALQVADVKGHQVLLLTAFGCGTNKNPPKDVAQIFHDVCKNWTSKNLRALVFVMKPSHAKQDKIAQAFLSLFQSNFDSISNIVQEIQT